MEGSTPPDEEGSHPQMQLSPYLPSLASCCYSSASNKRFPPIPVMSWLSLPLFQPRRVFPSSHKGPGDPASPTALVKRS